MDKQIDDFCEGKFLRETPIEVLNARRKRNEEIESIAEKSSHLLPSGRKAQGLLIPGEQDEIDH